MKKDFVAEINDFDATINGKLKTKLNSFFNKNPEYAEGCILRKDWDGAPYALIIESSMLYSALSGEFGWNTHTKFYDTFIASGWIAEPMNSCVIGFYKD